MRRLALPLAAMVIMSAAAANPSAAHAAPSGSGSDTRPIPQRIFADTSFWYQKLPANTPLDPNSTNIIAALKQAGIQEYGNQERGLPSLALSTETPLAVAQKSDPQIKVGFNNCQNAPAADPGFLQQISALHVPPGLIPGGGTDKEVTLVNPEEDSVTDLWVVENASSPAMAACWGGKIDHASHSSGVFPAPYGSTASGLALAGGMIRAQELASGQINHVVGIALPVSVVNGKISTPANRTDGNQDGANTVSEGQLLRLPADLDIESLHLSAPAKTMAKNAQQYGWIVWDRSGGNSFRLEDPRALQKNPYPEAFDGYQGYDALWGDPSRGHQPFPFDKLQVVQSNYRTAEASSSASPEPSAIRPSSQTNTPRPGVPAQNSATPETNTPRPVVPAQNSATPEASQAAEQNSASPTPAPTGLRPSERIDILRAILKLLEHLTSPSDSDDAPPSSTSSSASTPGE